MTHRYFTEMKRRYYTTPSSYLELLKLYSSTLERKNKELTTMRAKIENGLNVFIKMTYLYFNFWLIC